MLINHAEMDVLRLAAWCKDLPQNTPQCLHADTWNMLLRMGYLQSNRSGICHRPAAKALDLLQSAGYDYPQDTRKLSGGSALTRRLELTELVLFLYSMGADVFLEGPTQQRPTISFLPSFTFRRAKGSNVLGGTRLTGFLYAPQITFIPYYISSGREGIYPHIEQMTFSMEHLNDHQTPAVIYIGKPDLPDLLRNVIHAAEVKFKSGAVTYQQAMGMFTAPVCFVPLSADGARQLRIMCQPDYRKEITRVFLKKNGCAPSEFTWCDAIDNKTGDPFLVGVDMNLKGFDRALGFAKGKMLRIAVLDFQYESAASYLKDKEVSLSAMPLGNVEKLLSLSGLPGPDITPYQTKEGGYINVSAI